MIYIVISNYITEINGTNIIIYVDETEKHFSNLKDAEDYRQYLLESYPHLDVMIYAQNVYQDGELNLNEMRVDRALAKLTDAEKTALGLG